MSYLPDREVYLCKYFSGCTATEYITYDSFMQLEQTLVVLLMKGEKLNGWIKEIVVDKVDPPCPLIGKNSSDYLDFWIYFHRKKAWPTYKDQKISKAT